MSENSIETNEKFTKRLRDVGLAGLAAGENLRRALLRVSGGFNLDKIGELYGIKRKPLESGGNFRKRVLGELRKKPKFK